MTDLAWSPAAHQPAPDAELSDAELSDAELSDAELTELALGADPLAPLAADAVPLDLFPDAPGGMLPAWYMPPVMARKVRKRWHRVAIGAVVVAFLVIDLCGLCSTYGPLVAA